MRGRRYALAAFLRQRRTRSPPDGLRHEHSYAMKTRARFGCDSAAVSASDGGGRCRILADRQSRTSPTRSSGGATARYARASPGAADARCRHGSSRPWRTRIPRTLRAAWLGLRRGQSACKRSVVTCPPSSRRPALQRRHAPAALATAPAACAGRLGTCPRGACGHRATAACAHPPARARRDDRARAPAVAARQRPAPAGRWHHPIVGSVGRLLDSCLTASSESLLLGLVRLSAYTSPGVATALRQSTDASAIAQRASRRRWCCQGIVAIPASPTSGRTAGSTTRKAQQQSRGVSAGAPASPSRY